MTDEPLILAWGRTEPMRCPRCEATLRSATGIANEPITPYAGAATLCDQCFTWLIFERRVFPSPSLSLRRATDAEIASIDPDRAAVAKSLAEFLSTTERKQ